MTVPGDGSSADSPGTLSSVPVEVARWPARRRAAAGGLRRCRPANGHRAPVELPMKSWLNRRVKRT